MSDFFKARTAVVLGGAGAIGSTLVERLIKEGIRDVWVADDLSVGETKNLPKNVKAYQCDLRNPIAAYHAVYKADLVFHLACATGGRGFSEGHDTQNYDNLSLDATIFRACSGRVEKVFFASSACAYPIGLQQDINQDLRLSEDLVDYKDTKQADSPYGQTKLMGELTLDAYVREKKFKGVVARFFTAYGPRMKETHALAAFMAKIICRTEPFEVWGDGTAKRNWTHVNDIVQGICLIMEKAERGVYNVGVEEVQTPNSALEMLWEITGWRPSVIQHLMNKPVGVLNRIADASKIKALGWKPEYELRRGLQETWEIYKETHTVQDCLDLTRRLTER